MYWVKLVKIVSEHLRLRSRAILQKEKKKKIEEERGIKMFEEIEIVVR